MKKTIGTYQMPGLVELTANLLRTLNKNTSNASSKSAEMHFVADLLKDLVDTAYPMEEKQNTEDDFTDIKNLIRVAEFQSFDEMMEAVAEIARATKPPKAGEF